MRIAIDASALGSGQGGDETMMTGLLSGLAVTATATDRVDLICRVQATLPTSVSAHPSFRRHDVHRAGGSRYFAQQLPKVLRALSRPDLFLAVNHAPVRAPSPVVLMVQDLSFEHHPEHYPWHIRRRLQTVVRHQVRRAHHVATISEFSRQDLLETYDLAPDHVSVIPLAILPPPTFGPAERKAAIRLLRERGIHGRFVLYLGNLHPRKNLGRLVEAMAMVRQHPACQDLQLVIAGSRWWGRDDWDGNDDGIVALGFVDDDVREVLLRLADVLAYPSLFEGFGLPPLEAMARGTPVVASATTAVGETVGDAALRVDPTDSASIAHGIQRVLTDPRLATSLSAAGLERAACYSVDATGRAVRLMLEEVGTRLTATGAPTR